MQEAVKGAPIISARQLRVQYGDREILHGLDFETVKPTDQPAFYRGEFFVDEPLDTFVALERWSKGVCFINGFNLGRYWNTEPYRNLYLPGPLLKPGMNEIVLFELEGQTLQPTIELVNYAIKPEPVLAPTH